MSSTHDNAAAKKVVDSVFYLASGAATGEAARINFIKELAALFKTVRFSVLVSKSVRGEVRDYLIGIALGKTDEVRFDGVKNEFMLTEPKRQIESGLVVPMIGSKDLAITATKSVGISVLNSISFKEVDYQVLPLQSVATTTCRLVLTSALTGCTFAIGNAGTTLYMGHAQPDKDVKFAATGAELGENLSEKSTTMFEAVTNLDSTFFIRSGKEFKFNESGITYPEFVSANVFGLVSDHKIYFIVATKTTAGSTEGMGIIKNVVLVTQESTKQWKTERLL